MLNKRLVLRILFNSLLGLALVFIWSRFVNFEQTWGILRTVDIKFAFLVLVILSFSGILRGSRLKLLLQDYKLPLKDLIMLTYLGQFLSFLIPIRAGELSKSVYLNSQYDLPFAKTVVWVFIDRFLDFWMVLLLISIFLGFLPNVPVASLIKTVPLLLVSMSLATLFFIKSQSFSKKLAKFFSNFLIFPKIQSGFLSFTTSLIEGFEVLNCSILRLISIMVITLIAIAFDSLVWLVIFFSLGINFSIFQTVLGNSLTALTFLVPSAPGYVGSAEAAGLAVFSGILGMEANNASASILMFHILTLLALPIFGISSLYFLKFDLGLVWKKIRKNDS